MSDRWDEKAREIIDRYRPENSGDLVDHIAAELRAVERKTADVFMIPLPCGHTANSLSSKLHCRECELERALIIADELTVDWRGSGLSEEGLDIDHLEKQIEIARRNQLSFWPQ